MSRGTVDRCLGHRCISGLRRAWAWWSAEWLVVAVWVEGELAEEFAGLGVDDADVAVGDESDESFPRVFAAQADVVEPAVVADGEDAGGVGAVASGPVVDADRWLWKGAVAQVQDDNAFLVRDIARSPTGNHKTRPHYYVHYCVHPIA
jgi:hypothetical protein